MNSITFNFATGWPQALTTTVQRWAQQSPTGALACALGAVYTLGMALDRPPYITTDAEAHDLIALYEAADMGAKPVFESDNQIVRANRIAAWFETGKGRAAALHCYQIDLSNRELTQLPRQISRFINLESLWLSNNQLQTLPPVIENLVNLRYLVLDSNQLQTLSPVIGKLANLRYLGLESNQLKTLPPEIKNLANLQDLRLNNNQLQTLPNTIGNLTTLQTLRLNNNQLQTLPNTIGNLANLECLGLNSNRLQTLPPTIRNLANLKTLWLENNPLKSASILFDSFTPLLQQSCHIHINDTPLSYIHNTTIPDNCLDSPHWHMR